MASRKKIPAKTETKILIDCRRRCCLCFHLQNDLIEKRGQLAHINGNRDDNRELNLVWLCLEHHDTFDSSTSQSKNYTANEVKSAKLALVERMKRFNNPESCFLTLEIEKTASADLDGVTSALFAEIEKLIERKSEIKIKNKSIRNRPQIEIQSSEVEALNSAFESGKLDKFGVNKIQVDRFVTKPSLRFHQGLSNDSLLKHVASEPQILQTFQQPDCSEHFSNGIDSDAGEFTYTIRMKTYGVHDQYLLLVFANRHPDGTIYIDTCLRVFNSTFHFNQNSSPTKIAIRFFESFGFPFELTPGLRSTFFCNLEIPFHGFRSHAEWFERIVAAEIGQNRRFEYGYLLGEEVPPLIVPKQLVFVNYAYVLNTAKYVSYLLNHRVRLPSQIVELFGPEKS